MMDTITLARIGRVVALEVIEKKKGGVRRPRSTNHLAAHEPKGEVTTREKSVTMISAALASIYARRFKH